MRRLEDEKMRRLEDEKIRKLKMRRWENGKRETEKQRNGEEGLVAAPVPERSRGGDGASGRSEQ
jgi:hypothetical protein